MKTKETKKKTARRAKPARPPNKRIEKKRRSFPAQLGLAAGAKGDSVVELQTYLRKFGYLKAPAKGDSFARMRARAPASAFKAGAFDNATKEALGAYQRFHGLPVSHVLDDATIAQMSMPRCGVPDMPILGGSLARYVVQGNRWPNTNLTYRIQNFTGDLTAAAIRTAVASAFSFWSAVTPLTFTEVAGNADILISFVTGNHGDGASNAFDGAGGVLAHAYYPPPNGGAIAGDAHFDDAETWAITIPVPANRIDLVSVATHEFGHSLGLNHSAVGGSLMFPTYSGPHRFLSQDDLDGIRAIYGPRQSARVSVPGWFGAANQGADIALADISGNGRPDLVVFHVDNPGGENHGYYRIGWNLNNNGVPTAWSSIMNVPGWFGAEDQGAGIAIADISGNGRPDLVVFHIDNPGGENRGFYRIGWNLNLAGVVTGGWTGPIPIPGWFGAENQGAAIALADVNGNGRPDLIVFHIDNPGGENHGYYRIGWNLSPLGMVTGGWSPIQMVPGWFGAEDQGAGIAVADLNGSGRPDLVVFHVDNPGGENHGYYRIGRDLSLGGLAASWGPVIPVTGWFGAEDQGAGIALGNINSAGTLDLVVFHVDNPAGENHGYYRTLFDL